MSSIIKVNTVQDVDGNNIINENANTITIGKSGDTVTVAGGATFVGGGIEWQSSIVTAATITVESGKGYWLDTSSNAITVTLPAAPSVGDQIILVDYARNWNTNAVTIDQNSKKFQGETSPNPIYNEAGQVVDIVYSGTTKGWTPLEDQTTTDKTGVLNIDYLCVAGGGGAGSTIGGGGGAGGMATATGVQIARNVTYTVTVGSGQTSSTQGDTGGVSSIAGSGLPGGTTISAVGGGNGGNHASGTAGGTAGGSGGGGGANGGAGTNAGGSGTSGQGNDGGSSQNDNYGGGGGGKGAAGQSTTGGTANGGNGEANSITGSSVTYAGGGSGGSRAGLGNGSGGSGGGGNGGNYPSGNGGNGTDGLGGGGGGPDGNGGDGVVIIRLLTSLYTGTTTGSPSVGTDGSHTVLTFTGSGSYTS